MNMIICLYFDFDIEMLKMMLEGMRDCLEKDGDYNYLIIYKDGNEERGCYFITDRQIFKDCINENLVKALMWCDQAHVDLLSIEFDDYLYEGDPSLLGR